MAMIAYSVFILINFVIVIIPLLMSVAYLMLGEGKVFGYNQTSKCPNMLSMYGMLHPHSDGVNLFSKQIIILNHINAVLYLFSPMMVLSLSLMVWSLMPLSENSTLADINWYLNWNLHSLL